MLRLTAERRASAKAPGAPTGHPSTTTEDIGVRDCSTKTAISNGLASRAARFAHRHPTITVAAGLLVLSAGILAAGPIAGHLPDIILGLCVVILGMLFGVLLAVRT